MSKSKSNSAIAKARNLSDIMNKRLLLTSYTTQESRDGKIYYVLAITDIDTGEKYTVGTGGVTVLKQIDAIPAEAYPVEFKVIQLGKMYALEPLESDYEGTQPTDEQTLS